MVNLLAQPEATMPLVAWVMVPIESVGIAGPSDVGLRRCFQAHGIGCGQHTASPAAALNGGGVDGGEWRK
jgi:hypothetical protein